MSKNIVFFDVETNGKVGSSVLSISAIKVNFNGEIQKWEKVGEYDRFYFRNPGEAINMGAINVNGLTDDVLEKKREEKRLADEAWFETKRQISWYFFCFILILISFFV